MPLRLYDDSWIKMTCKCSQLVLFCWSSVLESDVLWSFMQTEICGKLINWSRKTDAETWMIHGVGGTFWHLVHQSWQSTENVTGLLTNDAEGRLKVKIETEMTSRPMENGYTKKWGVPVFHFPYPDGTGFRDNPCRSPTDHKRSEATDKGEAASNLKLYGWRYHYNVDSSVYKEHSELVVA